MDTSFFDVLYENDDFAKALGRLLMSSAKFETCLKQYMDAHGKVQYGAKSPLGHLLKLLIENQEIDRTATEHFGFLLHQRNYFVHKLHLYLSEYPKDEFELDGFITNANGVSEEMEFFSSILKGRASKYA